MIKFGSLCSGIEAASVAWHPLGWRCAWVSEVDEFCSALLKHHYPAVENLGDMTKIEELLESRPELADIDVLVGGTPCVAFSIAGLRQSLSDARGNLTLVFCRIVDAIDKLKQKRGHKRPLVVLWENVPGVLNTNDNAFGCFLGALAGEGAAINTVEKWPHCGLASGPERQVAWRVIDAEGYVPSVEPEFLSARHGLLVGSIPVECFSKAKPILRDILEGETHPKYRLSSRACAGILRRAEKRGKKLPPLLEAALRAVADTAKEEEATILDL